MNEPKWVETKKEYDITDTGERVPKKVTLEPFKKKYAGFEKKEAIDVVLRVVSLLAIFIPLWLFFQQQKAELNKQKVLFQLDLYAQITTELHSLLDRPFNNLQFENSRTKLFYELDPKLKLLGDSKVISKFKELKQNIPLYLLCSKINANVDSFRHYTENMLVHIKSSPIPVAGTYAEDEKKIFYMLFYRIDSLHTDLISMQGVLQEEFIQKESYDTTGRTIMKSSAAVFLKNVNRIEETENYIVDMYDNYKDNNVESEIQQSPVSVDALEGLINNSLGQHRTTGLIHKKQTKDFNAQLIRDTEAMDSLMILSNLRYYGR